MKERSPSKTLLKTLSGALLACGLATGQTQAQQIQWGLTLTNINNPITPIVVTNIDGSISITAGGGDTYGKPDSLTYAYEKVSGDFDIQVQVVNVFATDPFGQDTPKGSLMMRSSLDASAYDVQINATPPDPSNRHGQIESIGRLDQSIDTDDLPGRLQKYGGDTTSDGYATYPDCWLRIQRQGNKVMTYFRTANPTDYPGGWASNPASTNGWQLLVSTRCGTNFGKEVYVGISTVAHNSNLADTDHIVTSTYANYGHTGTPPSQPTDSGNLVPAGVAPGAFPNTRVLAANFDASVAANGLGYPPDTVQSNQSAPQQIVWNSGGFGGVARDIIASIPSQSPGGFSFARYQAGAFDFLLSPRNPVASQQNLGAYSNPARVRYSSGDTNVAASQAWIPSPNYGIALSTVRKNGQVWNDTSGYFYAATYMQLDGVASANGYDMISGHYRGGQFYTRTTKLITGPTDPSSNLGNLQRAAMPIAVAWFPYDQGWVAGFFDDPDANGNAVWARGNGWGLHSGTAVFGNPSGGQSGYNSPANVLTWLQTGLGLLTLPGVNSTNDGMLFTIGNNEADSTRGPNANNAVLPDGSGWYVAVRDLETSKTDPTIYAQHVGNDAAPAFSFLYVPYNADNLVGGHITANGTTGKKAGNFSVARLAAGRYAVTIPGKTSADGVLMLQNAGYLASQPSGLTNVVDTSVLSYEFGGTNTPANAFIVESRFVDMSGGGDGVVKLRDADFNFVFVDFQNPLSPPGTVAPKLSVAHSGNNVVVSWTNGPGFVLQKTTKLSGSGTVWTDVGTANPSAPITVGSGAVFFRVRQP